MSFNFKCVRFGFAVRPYRRSKGCWKIVVYFITEFRLFLSCIGQILFFFKSTNKLKWSILEKEKKKWNPELKINVKKKKMKSLWLARWLDCLTVLQFWVQTSFLGAKMPPLWLLCPRLTLCSCVSESFFQLSSGKRLLACVSVRLWAAADGCQANRGKLHFCVRYPQPQPRGGPFWSRSPSAPCPWTTRQTCM